jgi:hypothetical protein
VDLEQARERAAIALASVHPRAESPVGGDWVGYKLSADEFPVPELVLFGLRDLRGLKSWGPMEKVRWIVDGTVGEVPFSVALQKFGLRLHLPADEEKRSLDSILRALHTAADVAELHLRTVAARQIESANVTIENRFLRFDGAYRFFRERALEAYGTPPPEPVVISMRPDGTPDGWSSQPFKPQVEGGHLAGAMLDAYFSRLEHLLVLMLAFADFDPATDSLVRFVGLRWSDKWKRLFDVAANESAKAAYDRLHRVKEAFRNPLAHGGFGKNGTSFFFHADGIGALPALLTDHDVSFNLQITPVPQESYEQVCADFDSVDEFLSSSSLWAGYRFANSGLDVSFAASSLQEYAEAAVSEESLEEFTHHEGYLHDMHANMDY